MGEPSDVSMHKKPINMKGSDMTKSSVMIQGLNALQMDCESEWRQFHEWLNQSESKLLACG